MLIQHDVKLIKSVDTKSRACNIIYNEVLGIIYKVALYYEDFEHFDFASLNSGA